MKMNSSNENRSKIKDVFLWFAVLLITVAAFFATYHYVLPGSVKAIVWIFWFVFALFISYFTEKGKEVFKFSQEAKIELLKVVLPSRQETVQTTTIVMVMVGVTGLVLWGVDSMMMWTIAKITHLG